MTETTETSSDKGRLALGLIFACFLALGTIVGFLGVAWPSMRATFGLPIDALVALFISSTAGFVAGSLVAGRAMARIGIGRYLLIMNLGAAAALFGYALAPGWWFLVSVGLLTGFTSGAIDTGLNIYIAATNSVRIMNWMHAMFGVGAAIGPLIMTAIVGSGRSWRLGYAVGGLIHLTLGFLLVMLVKRIEFRAMIPPPSAAGEKHARPEPLLATLKLPIVLLGIFLFLLYTGVESTAGQWTFSLFTEARAVSTYLAGLMTSVFWAALTLGRLLFGGFAGRIGIERLLRWSMIGTVVSAVLLLVRSPVAGFTSVALMGLSLAAIFPTLVSDTPHRVGLRHAANAIGIQTGAASVGFAILPGLAGFLAARMGLEVLGPFLVISSVMMLVTNEIAVQYVNRRRRQIEAAPVPLTGD